MTLAAVCNKAAVRFQDACGDCSGISIELDRLFVIWRIGEDQLHRVVLDAVSKLAKVADVKSPLQSSVYKLRQFGFPAFLGGSAGDCCPIWDVFCPIWDG